MPRHEDAGVPFAVIGVLLIIVSTIVMAYLMSMESAGISEDIGDDRDRDINKAITLAASDIATALNYAGLAAEAEVGKKPVVNASGPGLSGVIAEEDRIKDIACRLLSRYLEANYNGTFTYGDYSVSASLIGDYRSMSVIADNMTLYRNFDHPVIGCAKDYTAYYTIETPVRLTVTRAGSDMIYSEDRVIRCLITSRYPLLKQMTDEYERRLNGTPMFLDLTAASFAYTWTRGYTQYATGSPLNIVDNSQLELIANGAMLLEQGFEFNSVDPIGLATLAGKCIGNGARPSEVNSYDPVNNSKEGLPQNRTGLPEKYSFNVDEMADRAYDNVSFGGYAANSLDGSYTMRMYLDIGRDRDYYPRVNSTGIVEESSRTGTVPAIPGDWTLLTRTFRVCRDNSDGKGYADRVTVAYKVSGYSVLQYFGPGKLMSSSSGIGDPVLEGSSNDVEGPFDSYVYEKDLIFGHKAFTDCNLQDAVKCYEDSFDSILSQGYFERTLADILNDRDRWRSRVPAAFLDRDREFVCGPGNRPPVWAEIEADYELRDLCSLIKKEMVVDIDPGTCGDSPAAMAQSAYRELDGRFRSSYDGYLDRQSYFSETSGAGNQPLYRSCGTKAIFRIREAFLEDLRRQLDDAAGNCSDRINEAIDRQMEGTGQSSSNLTDNIAGAKSYLSSRFYIPFGLAMTLNSSMEFASGYPWQESVTLAIDQSPACLDTGLHTDEDTGYTARTLRLRNICLFSPAANIPWTDEVADRMAEPLLQGIDTIAENVDQVANRTIVAESNELVEAVASGTRDGLKREINALLGEDPCLSGTVSGPSVERAVDHAWERRGNDSKAIVGNLNDGTLIREIAGEIVNDSADSIRAKAHEYTDGYVDEYTGYVARRVEEKIADAEHEVIVQVTGSLKDRIRGTFMDFAVEAGSNAALGKVLGSIPSGLPLLPPYGWWATINVWYIEVQGEIPVFTVYDADIESVPDPVFGGAAMSYTRRHQAVTDADGHYIGNNEPLKFTAKTSTFILVPPGTQGVGDKAGGWDEKSTGFDEETTSS